MMMTRRLSHGTAIPHLADVCDADVRMLVVCVGPPLRSSGCRKGLQDNSMMTTMSDDGRQRRPAMMQLVMVVVLVVQVVVMVVVVVVLVLRHTFVMIVS